MRWIANQRRAGHFDNRHSRWVARLKVVLPLIAVIILSTLFLLADRRGTGGNLPYSDVDLDRMLGEGRIAGPAFSGIGNDGAAVWLSAREAWPEGPDMETMRARAISGTWESTSGARVSLTARTGGIDGRSDRVSLEGDVSVRDAQGYRLKGTSLDIDLESGDVGSADPVVGTGPAGRIEAGAMQLEQRGGKPLLTFTEGVKVLYDPAAPEGSSQEPTAPKGK